MKKLTLLLMVSAIIIAACSKGSAPGGPVTPPPPAPVAAKISSISVAPSSSIVLTGMNPSNRVTVNVTAIGNPTPSITINNVSGAQYTSPDLFESASFPISASNGVGSPDVSAANVIVTIDSIFQKLAGTSMAGRSFRMIAATRQPIGGGTVTDIMNDCLRDDVFTFYPNCTNQTNHGNVAGCPTGLSLFYKYEFNSSNPNNMLLKLIDIIPAQPDRKVEFPSSTTMVHSYDYNGFHYIQTFQAQ